MTNSQLNHIWAQVQLDAHQHGLVCKHSFFDCDDVCIRGFFVQQLERAMGVKTVGTVTLFANGQINTTGEMKNVLTP